MTDTKRMCFENLTFRPGVNVTLRTWGCNICQGDVFDIIDSNRAVIARALCVGRMPWRVERKDEDRRTRMLALCQDPACRTFAGAHAAWVKNYGEFWDDGTACIIAFVLGSPESAMLRETGLPSARDCEAPRNEFLEKAQWPTIDSPPPGSAM